MNAKGTFTAMFGAMVLIMVISSTYYAITDLEAQDSPKILRQAGDMKRAVTKARFFIDDSIAPVIAAQVVNENCSTGGVYTDAVRAKIVENLQRTNNLTGIECTLIDLTDVRNNTAFTVTLTCILEGITTTSSFDLEKSITAETQDGSCQVTVTDTDSGVVQATFGA